MQNRLDLAESRHPHAARPGAGRHRDTPNLRERSTQGRIFADQSGSILIRSGRKHLPLGRANTEQVQEARAVYELESVEGNCLQSRYTVSIPGTYLIV